MQCVNIEVNGKTPKLLDMVDDTFRISGKVLARKCVFDCPHGYQVSIENGTRTPEVN